MSRATRCARAANASPTATSARWSSTARARRCRSTWPTESDTYQTTCSAGQPGGDIAIALTLAEAAGLEVQFNQTGRSIFGLFRMPGPGLACDANQRACAFEDQAANSVAFVDLPAGRYVFIVKAQAGRAGSINLRFSAFSGRRVEICGNNIDDDTNGLIDCADPACFGVVGCPAPACVPDQDLGSFAWGTSRTVTVDTRAGGTLYPTTCSRGTGRERVLRLTLTQMMSLAHDCTDTGSHVFELSRQLQPLDACNENDIVCVDPAVLPFGCGYSLPELQPGKYNLIVQAFQAGSEGVVTLTLTGLQSTCARTAPTASTTTTTARSTAPTASASRRPSARGSPAAPTCGGVAAARRLGALGGRADRDGGRRSARDHVRQRGWRPGRRHRLPGAGDRRRHDAVGAGG